MPKAIFALVRNFADEGAMCLMQERMRLVSRRLLVDSEGDHNDCIVDASGDGCVTCIVAPVVSSRLSGSCVQVGYVEGEFDDYEEPGSSSPDGTYALIRSNSDVVELIADAMGSRPIWYWYDELYFFASTSQRALIMLMQSFQPDQRIYPWFLANGVIGPIDSFDVRLKRVWAGEVVRFDRRLWSLSRIVPEVSFSSTGCTDDHYRLRFQEALEATIGTFDISSGKWALPLSGGYDSRLLACLLPEHASLTAVTWGMGDSVETGDVETKVAAELAEALSLPHRYFPLSLSREGIAVVLDRFVRMSEGMTDNISAYLDGFRLWSALRQSGIEGIIRGDEAFGGFGWSPVRDERSVRLSLGLGLLQDYPGTQWLAELPGMYQVIPEQFARRGGEELDVWRYRLFHDYRVPVALAALTEAKTAFVDVVNPLQFRRIVEVVRDLPSHLRNDKRLLIETVHKLSPDVPYGSVREGDQLLHFLRSATTMDFLYNELVAARSKGEVMPEVIVALLGRLSAVRNSGTTAPMYTGIQCVLQWLKASTPRVVKRRLKSVIGSTGIELELLALRAWILSRTNQMLCDDSRLLRA